MPMKYIKLFEQFEQEGEIKDFLSNYENIDGVIDSYSVGKINSRFFWTNQTKKLIIVFA